MWPRQHPGGLGQVEAVQAHEEPKHGAAKRLGQARGVVRGPRHKRPIGPEPAVRDEPMPVRMPVGARAVRLETGHDPHQEVALTGQRTDRGGDRERGDAGDLAEQASTIQAIRAEPLRDGEDDLPVRHGCEERGVEPLGPDGEAFRVAAGTEVPTLAGEREQVLVGTGVTPDAREAVLEDAAGEELVRDLADHGAPRAVLVREALVVHRLQAVEMILHQPEQRRRLWTSGLVDAEGHRRRVCRGVCRGVCHVPQARSQTMERRAYGRLARGLSSWCCVAGYSDATSDECGPNSACCCRADQ